MVLVSTYWSLKPLDLTDAGMYFTTVEKFVLPFSNSSHRDISLDLNGLIDLAMQKEMLEGFLDSLRNTVTLLIPLLWLYVMALHFVLLYLDGKRKSWRDTTPLEARPTPVYFRWIEDPIEMKREFYLFLRVALARKMQELNRSVGSQ